MQLLRRSIASIVAFLFVILLVPQAASRAQTLSMTDCTTSQLSDVMGIYLTVPAPKETQPPIPGNVKSYLSKALSGRLAACQQVLPPSPDAGTPCLPGSGEENQPNLLWTHLRFCELLVMLPDAFGTTQFLEGAPDWVADWTGQRCDSSFCRAAWARLFTFLFILARNNFRKYSASSRTSSPRSRNGGR